ETNDREFARYTDIALSRRTQYTDSDHVVTGKYGAGRILFQQQRSSAITAGTGEVAFQHSLLWHLDACLFQRPAVTGQAHLRHTGMRRTADTGDVPMPQLEQVSRRQIGTVFVIDAHQIRINPLQPPVD